MLKKQFVIDKYCSVDRANGLQKEIQEKNLQKKKGNKKIRKK